MAEPYIYGSITLNTPLRGRSLQSALVTKPRRQALVRKLHLQCLMPLDKISFLLSILSNLQSLHALSLYDSAEPNSILVFQPLSLLKEVRFRTLEAAPILTEFFASQPYITRLCIDMIVSASPIPLQLLPGLEVLAGGYQIITQYVPGRPVKKVPKS